MRNLYALTPGELLVGERLEARGFQVWLPTKDKGVDLLATKDGGVLRLQVKESRAYLQPAGEPAWTSWTQLKVEQLKRAAEMGVDLFVFVVHAPVDEGHRLRFKPLYVLIPPLELEERLRRYRLDGDRAVYWFVDRDGRLWEVRDRRRVVADYADRQERDFTAYLEAWPR